MSQARSLNPDKGPVGKHKPDGPGLDDKLKTMIAFRRKNGLCFKCGEKWGHGHKCPPQVSLHVIEELLDAIDMQGDSMSDSDEEEAEPDCVLAVSLDTSAVAPKRTMKLHGMVGDKKVLILVDSGSVATFVSDQLVKQLQLQTTL